MLTTRNLLIVFSLAWVLLGAACASLNINLPSVTDTPTGLRLPGKVIWRGLRIAVPKSRPDHAEIIAAFEAAIAEMREDGSYDSILGTFRISTW